MNLARSAAAFAACASLSAFGCSSSSHAPTAFEFDAAPTSDDVGVDAHDATSADAVDSGSTPDATGETDADAPSEAGDSGDGTTSDASDAIATLCSPTRTFATVSATPVASSLGDDLYPSISADELAIAWTVADATAGAIYYAERASTAVAFGTPRKLATGVAFDRAALSPDGLRLIAATPDGAKLEQFTRPSRTMDFVATADMMPFFGFNLIAGNSGASLGDLVLADDDETFLYSFVVPGQPSAYVVARATPTDPWTGGGGWNGMALSISGTERRRPSGVAHDLHTMFYWDETSGTEKMGFFDALRSAFFTVVDLGARRGAAPNAACDRVYFSGPSAGGGLDIYTAQ